jgi:hypothetical protein
MQYRTPGEINMPPPLKPRFVLTDTVGALFDFGRKARDPVKSFDQVTQMGDGWAIFKK